LYFLAPPRTIPFGSPQLPLSGHPLPFVFPAHCFMRDSLAGHLTHHNFFFQFVKLAEVCLVSLLPLRASFVALFPYSAPQFEQSSKRISRLPSELRLFSIVAVLLDAPPPPPPHTRGFVFGQSSLQTLRGIPPRMF